MKIKVSNKGFTIVEVLISTTVFTVLLLGVITIVFLFTREYYKSVNSSSTQSAAQAILNDVTTAIEYSSSPFTQPASPATGITTYCIGNQQFDFEQIKVSPPTYSNIWESDLKNPSCLPITSATATYHSRVLLGNNMQLLRLNITATSNNLYAVEVEVAYGHDNFLCNVKRHPDCTATGSHAGNIDIGQTNADDKCLQANNSDFCDVSDLTATVGSHLH